MDRNELIDLAAELRRLSSERLIELKDNAELSRTFHDGRTTAALRSAEKQRCINDLVVKVCDGVDQICGGDSHEAG